MAQKAFRIRMEGIYRVSFKHIVFNMWSSSMRTPHSAVCARVCKECVDMRRRQIEMYDTAERTLFGSFIVLPHCSFRHIRGGVDDVGRDIDDGNRWNCTSEKLIKLRKALKAFTSLFNNFGKVFFLRIIGISFKICKARNFLKVHASYIVRKESSLPYIGNTEITGGRCSVRWVQ